MTDASPAPDDIRPRIDRALLAGIALWIGFVAVHFWLGILALYGDGQPLGDVTLVYKFWVEHGFTTGSWVGIDTVWVYPILALVPMLMAYLFGPDFYASTWLSLVMLVDAIAFAVVVGFHRDPRLVRVGWWWLGFLVLLGPIALGRIDSIMVPFGIMGVLALATMPRLAATLLTVATWIKVWPAALVAAAIVAVRERRAIIAAALVTSAVIAAVGLLLGGGTNLLSFVTQQTGRGLQVEAPISTFWMWDAFTHRPGGASVYYDTAILTYQLHGQGVDVASAVMTPLLALVTATILILGVLAIRRGIPSAEVLPPLLLSVTTALILFNKVGSPQFVTWLAVPLVYGITQSVTGRGASFRVPATLGLVIAALTQAIYPYLYWQLLSLNFTMLLALTARNLLYVALLGWAMTALVGLFRTPMSRVTPDSVAKSWPFAERASGH